MSTSTGTATLWNRLKMHWVGKNAVPNTGTSPEAVGAFEVKHGVKLPADLADYFVRLNGMDLEAPAPRGKRFRIEGQDDDCFSFWPLQRVARASEEGRPRQAFEGAEDYFVFADYMDWSWAYAIRLSGDGLGETPVIIVGGTKDGSPLPLARNFSAFVELYLRGPDAIWIPKAVGVVK